MAIPIHIGIIKNNPYLYDSSTYFWSKCLFFMTYASEAAGKIVVAIEPEIINGNLAIGSATPKYPITVDVKKVPIIKVHIL